MCLKYAVVGYKENYVFTKARIRKNILYQIIEIFSSTCLDDFLIFSINIDQNVIT